MTLSIFSEGTNKSYDDVVTTYAAFINAWNKAGTGQTVHLEAFQDYSEGLPGVFKTIATHISNTIRDGLIILNKDTISLLKDKINESNQVENFKDLIITTSGPTYYACLEALPKNDFQACLTEFKTQLNGFDYDAVPSSTRRFIQGLRAINQLPAQNRAAAADALNQEVNKLRTQEMGADFTPKNDTRSTFRK
ncbi:MAG: hypothetical protein JSS53_02100 [Proteobacteria bacterium]|nr:hypothetical protein [Pseudomonadota bacterium]